MARPPLHPGKVKTLTVIPGYCDQGVRAKLTGGGPSPDPAAEPPAQLFPPCASFFEKKKKEQIFKS